MFDTLADTVRRCSIGGEINRSSYSLCHSEESRKLGIFRQSIACFEIKWVRCKKAGNSVFLKIVGNYLIHILNEKKNYEVSCGVGEKIQE
jgi:hypothetical protein